jgi:hypothetical protein
VGLWVFEGEGISAEVEGKLGVRIASVALALSGNSSATLHRMSGGTHVDMESGWSYLSSAANSSLEVHAIDALLRPAKNQPTQGRVRIYTRQALQVSAIRGDLLLTYRDESRIITGRQNLSDQPGPGKRNAEAGGIGRGKFMVHVGPCHEVRSRFS